MLPGESQANEGHSTAVFATGGSASVVGQNPYELRPHDASVSNATQVASNPLRLMALTPPAGLARFSPSLPKVSKSVSEHEAQIFFARVGRPSHPDQALIYPPPEVVNGSFVPSSLDKTATEQ
jgi:hypothetical protein